MEKNMDILRIPAEAGIYSQQGRRVDVTNPALR